MTQVVRQKWVLGVAAVNALLALALMAVVGVGLSAGQRATREGFDRRDAQLREQLEAVRAELAAQKPELLSVRAELRSGLEELRHARQASPADSHLAQTLQLVASEQQLLLLRSMQPPAPSKPAQRSARRARPLRQQACKVSP